MNKLEKTKDIKFGYIAPLDIVGMRKMHEVKEVLGNILTKPKMEYWNRKLAIYNDRKEMS